MSFQGDARPGGEDRRALSVFLEGPDALPGCLCFNSNYEDETPLEQLHSTEDMV